MLGIVIIILFALLVSTITMYIAYSRLDRPDPEVLGTMTTEEIQVYIAEFQSSRVPMFWVLPLMAFVGILVGSVSYMIMNSKVEMKNTVIKKDSKIILNFLNPNEKRVVDKLLENQGKVQQIELSRLPDMSKVKTHRLLNDMERKGIIKRERYGKVNLIVLDKGLYEALTN